MNFITLDNVCNMHSALVSDGGKCMKTLKLIFDCLNVKFGVDDHYFNSAEKSWMLLYFFVKLRPFDDGNKRTAIACIEELYKANNWNLPKQDFFRVAQMIEIGLLEKADFLHAFGNHERLEMFRSLLMKP